MCGWGGVGTKFKEIKKRERKGEEREKARCVPSSTSAMPRVTTVTAVLSEQQARKVLEGVEGERRYSVKPKTHVSLCPVTDQAPATSSLHQPVFLADASVISGHVVGIQTYTQPAHAQGKRVPASRETLLKIESEYHHFPNIQRWQTVWRRCDSSHILVQGARTRTAN